VTVAAARRATALRIKTSVSGTVLPGLAAGVIYFVIAFATGTSIAASIIGGIVVAVIAIAIGFIFRAVFTRRSRSRRR
jgi:predicted lipid-binding transport protein (Tim44 family)